MLWDGIEAKAESQASLELLGDVMKILLASSEANAAQLRLVASSFMQMAADFNRMAKDIEDRNGAIMDEFAEQADKLEAQAKQMQRKSGLNALNNAAAKIRAAITRKK